MFRYRHATVLGITALVLSLEASAMECDSFALREQTRAEASQVLNEYLNSGLAQAVDVWNGSVNRTGCAPTQAPWKAPRLKQAGRCPRCGPEFRFASLLSDRIGGPNLKGTLETWLESVPTEYRLTPGRDSVYRGTSVLANRMLSLATIGLIPWSAEQFFVSTRPPGSDDGALGEIVRIGGDKLDHFFSEGFKYHDLLVREGRTIEEVLRLGEWWERTKFGLQVSGVFSNADLVANYEGLRFYNTLFSGGDGHAPLVEWIRRSGEAPRIRTLRPFDLREWVNPYWDEVTNPSAFTPVFWRSMRRNMKEVCASFHRVPALFAAGDLKTLSEQYPGIHFARVRSQSLSEACR